MGPVEEVNLEELSSCTALSLFEKEVSSQAVQPRVLLMLSILVRSIFSFPLCRNQWVFHVFIKTPWPKVKPVILGLCSWLPAGRVSLMAILGTRGRAVVFSPSKKCCVRVLAMPQGWQGSVSLLPLGHCGPNYGGQFSEIKLLQVWALVGVTLLRAAPKAFIWISSLLMFVVKWAKKGLKDRTEALTQLSNV